MIFEKHDVSISRDLARFGNTKYPINNITSYSVLTTEIPHGNLRKTIGGLTFSFFMLATLFNFSINSSIVNFVLALIGGGIFYWGYISRNEELYSLKLSTAGGEMQVYQTKNKSYIDEIESALDLAMNKSD